MHHIALLLATTLPSMAQSVPHLIPMPRQITGQVDLPVENGVDVVCEACDADDLFAASDLRHTFAERGLPTANPAGLRIVLQRLAQHPDATFTQPMRAEGYTITFASNTLTLTGDTAEGVFYAAQTAKQMIEGPFPTSPCAGLCPPFVLHAATIHDYPAMKYRGLHDDLSRGPVDTLEFQKKLVPHPWSVQRQPLLALLRAHAAIRLKPAACTSRRQHFCGGCP